MRRPYLDPKNDIVFKRIFGEHPLILRSFLNALLPLPPDGQIVSLDYLPSEQIPQLPLFKYSIVDVRCVDQRGRQFIVEMQMNWTSAFLQRVLYNASKAFVRQLEKGEEYKMLEPVIALSVLDDIFDRESESFYHHYRMVNVEQPQRAIDGLQLVFIELPKFKPRGKLAPLAEAWLRFLREADTQRTPEKERAFQAEVANQAPEIQEAMTLAGESAFTPGELEAYDRYWDAIRSERTLISGKYADGKAEGKAEGLAEGEAKGKAAGLAEGKAAGKAEGLAEGFAQGRESLRAALVAKLLAQGFTTEQAIALIE